VILSKNAKWGYFCTSLEQKVIGKKVVGATPLFFLSLTLTPRYLYSTYLVLPFLVYCCFCGYDVFHKSWVDGLSGSQAKARSETPV